MAVTLAWLITRRQGVELRETELCVIDWSWRWDMTSVPYSRMDQVQLNPVTGEVEITYRGERFDGLTLYLRLESPGLQSGAGPASQRLRRRTLTVVTVL